jgi:hypothetical protein
MPPQHGKSEGLTVRYPVWRLCRNHRLRVAVGAYNQTHANRFSRKSRKLARDLLPLSAERKAANEWETAAGGTFVAVGVGAGITGLPVDLLVKLGEASIESDGSIKVSLDRLPLGEVIEIKEKG